MKAVIIKGRCPRCQEEIEFLLSKKQLKAIFKSMKATTEIEAERITERELGRDEKGEFKL